MSHAITLKFENGCVMWQCACGSKGKPAPIKPGQISALCKRAHKLGDGHLELMRKAVRVVDKIDWVEVNFDVQRVQEPG